MTTPSGTHLALDRLATEAEEAAATLDTLALDAAALATLAEERDEAAALEEDALATDALDFDAFEAEAEDFAAETLATDALEAEALERDADCAELRVDLWGCQSGGQHGPHTRQGHCRLT